MNESMLSDLETYASLMFSKSEIAVIMEVDPGKLSDLIGDPQSSAGKAFQRGRLKREAELRKGIFDLAQNGSSPAQTLALKLVENAKADDV
ncbi:MAG: hypothetical protein EOM90_04800 [Alphaproteobacteria bacterium]|nr:hypothetical protein [Alphaproteobacteria bacterium]